MFDVEKAIAAALEKSDFVPIEKKAQVPDGIAQKVLYGKRAVELSRQALEGQCDREFELERMAEGLAMQGDLESAIAIAPKRFDEYQKKLDAIMRSNDEKCLCPKNEMFFTEEIVHNGQVYSLYTCPKCGFTNAL